MRNGLAPYTPTLTTERAFKQFKSITSDDPSDDGWDDATILRIIRAVSNSMGRYTRRVFAPYFDTREFTHGSIFNPNGLRYDTLTMDEDLLSVTELTNATGTVIPADGFRGIPLNTLPKTHIRLSYSYTWTFTGDVMDTVSVQGVWGMVRRYPECYVATGQAVPAGGITANDITFTVADASVFSVLDYIYITAETLQITAIDTGTNTLTVTRGELGSTATAHAEATPIQRFQQLEDIEQACISWARWIYDQRNTTQERVQFLDGTSLSINEAPSNIRATMAQYRVSNVEVI